MRLVTLLLVLSSSAALADDVKVPEFIKPYPGSKLYGDPKQFDFDEVDMVVGKIKSEPPGPAFKRVQGRHLSFTFDIPEKRSTLEVYKNYEQALLSNGFEKVYACTGASECGDTVVMNSWKHAAYQFTTHEARYLTAKLSRPGEGDVWVALFVTPIGLPLVGVTVVQEKAMDTGMVTLDMNAMKKGLEQTGHIAVYGIQFDTGKATLKPESKPAFEEIKKLLDASPALKIYVVGHTDDVGDASANVALSNSRAAAVVTELTTKYKIAPARLKAQGVGPYVPVASNRNDAGKAKNRRVELVEMLR
ncbi:MAG TPA: OmpA family protein [Myxococcaceae bacterium]|nr:OmpA family protein [Myxococcaceae bacterium]